jgi:hypothetical protein
MGDIFDQAAQQAPSGDIFDQAAAAMQPQASFSQRIGERLKQNFDLPQQAENVRQAVNQALDPNNHKTDGFHDLWEGLKQTYKDPANMVADALSAYVGGQLHEPEPGAPKPAQAPAQAAPEGPSLTSRVMDAAQPRIQRAATRFLMKRIPGAHLAMDAMDFARDVSKTPEAPPAPPTPQAPTGPPEMWGKQIAAQEAPAPPAAMAEAAPRNPAAQSIPRTLSGESALRQVLTGQDNANLMKIAKARGINVAKESQLKPGVADNLLIKKVIDDFSPDELQEFSDKYLENSRFSHKFGDIGPEAWKTLSLQTYFPELKLAARDTKENAGRDSEGGPASAAHQYLIARRPDRSRLNATAAGIAQENSRQESGSGYRRTKPRHGHPR